MEEGWGVRDIEENNLSHHFLEEVAAAPQPARESVGRDRVPALPQPHKAPQGCHLTYVGSPVQHYPSSTLLRFITVLVNKVSISATHHQPGNLG